MIRISQGEFGVPYTFQWLEPDGITPRNLSSSTVIAYFKSLSNPQTIVQINCMISDPINGLYNLSSTTNLSTNIDEYELQFQQFISGILVDNSEPLNVTVEKSSAIAG